MLYESLYTQERSWYTIYSDNIVNICSLPTHTLYQQQPIGYLRFQLCRELTGTYHSRCSYYWCLELMKTKTVVAVLPGQSWGVRGNGWRAVRNSEESTPPFLPYLSPCTSRPHRPIPESPTRHLCGYPAHQNAEPVEARENNLKTLFQSVLHTLTLASFPGLTKLFVA